jgi:hypothetical protein
MSSNYEAPHCVTFSIPLLLHPLRFLMNCSMIFRHSPHNVSSALATSNLIRHCDTYMDTPAGVSRPSVEFLHQCPVVAADARLATGTAVISALLSLDHHLSHTSTSRVRKLYYQSVCRCFTQHLPAYTRIAKCFTNSSRRFRCEVMFANVQLVSSGLATR